MPLDLLSWGGELRLLPEQGAYLPGAVATIWVSVHSPVDLTVRSGRIDLRSVHRYTYGVTARPAGDGQTVRDVVTGTDEKIVDEQPFLEQGRIAAHHPFERAVSFRLPKGIPPSGTGVITATTWWVRAQLEVAAALDLRAEVPIAVLAPRDLHRGSVKRRATVRSDGECDLSFTFPRGGVRTGELLRGALVLTARREFEARGVRIELLRHELVKPPPDAGEGAASNSVETVVAETTIAPYLQLWPREARSLPFELAVSDDAHPTSRTKRGAVRWLLKGIVDRYLRDDDTIVQEVLCYSGSAAEAAAPTFP